MAGGLFATTGMKIRVLGPLSVSHDGIDGVPTARKPRQILSVLLLNESKVVLTSALIAELWDDAPPKSALTTLQTYILHIRKLLAAMFGTALADVAREILVTRHRGYTFRVGDGTFDLREFRNLAQRSRQTARRGDDPGTVQALREAMAQWDGPALADVEHGRILRAEVTRLEEMRLDLVERCIESELRLGRHRESVSELAGLVVQHPFHEDLHAQLMVALHRCGRRLDALAVFQRLRDSMVVEVGLEPSTKLHRLQRAILNADPSLDLGSPQPPVAVSATALTNP